MRPDGFTLLEALVAFVIAALALAALFSGGLAGLRGTEAAGRTLEATSRAQSHLDAAASEGALAAADRQGDEGRGFHWHVRVAEAAGSPRAGLALWVVSATVSWTEGGRTRAVQLVTERAAAAPPPP